MELKLKFQFACMGGNTGWRDRGRKVTVYALCGARIYLNTFILKEGKRKRKSPYRSPGDSCIPLIPLSSPLLASSNINSTNTTPTKTPTTTASHHTPNCLSANQTPHSSADTRFSRSFFNARRQQSTKS